MDCSESNMSNWEELGSDVVVKHEPFANAEGIEPITIKREETYDSEEDPLLPDTDIDQNHHITMADKIHDVELKIEEPVILKEEHITGSDSSMDVDPLLNPDPGEASTSSGNTISPWVDAGAEVRRSQRRADLRRLPERGTSASFQERLTEEEVMSDPRKQTIGNQEPHFFIIPNPRRANVPKVSFGVCHDIQDLLNATMREGSSATPQRKITLGSPRVATKNLESAEFRGCTVGISSSDPKPSVSAVAEAEPEAPAYSPLTPHQNPTPPSSEPQMLTMEQYTSLLQRVSQMEESLRGLVRDATSYRADQELEAWAEATVRKQETDPLSPRTPEVDVNPNLDPPARSVTPLVIPMSRIQPYQSGEEKSGSDTPAPAGVPRHCLSGLPKLTSQLVPRGNYHRLRDDADDLPVPRKGVCASCYRDHMKLHGRVCEFCRTTLRRWTAKFLEDGDVRVLPTCDHPLGKPRLLCHGCVIRAYVTRYNLRHPTQPHPIPLLLERSSAP